MAFAVKREGSSLSNTIQTNIESSSATNTNSQDVSITVNQPPKNPQTGDVEKQSKAAKDFASSRKSDVDRETLSQQMLLNNRLAEQTEVEKKETTPLNTESSRTFKSETFPLEKEVASNQEPESPKHGNFVEKAKSSNAEAESLKHGNFVEKAKSSNAETESLKHGNFVEKGAASNQQPGPAHISGISRSKSGTFTKKASSEPESATGQARSREHLTKKVSSNQEPEPGAGKKASSGETGPAFKSETFPLEK